MKIALDSNVLLYAEGANDDVRRNVARSVLGQIRNHELVISFQVLGEFFNVARRKLKYSSEQALVAVEDWRDYATIAPETSQSAFENGIALAVRHNLQIWDAIILATAAEAGCELLLSEDMNDGFVWRGVTIANPFAASPHPMMVDALRS